RKKSDNDSTTGTNETEANTVEIFQPPPIFTDDNSGYPFNTYQRYDMKIDFKPDGTIVLTAFRSYFTIDALRGLNEYDIPEGTKPEKLKFKIIEIHCNNNKDFYGKFRKKYFDHRSSVGQKEIIDYVDSLIFEYNIECLYKVENIKEFRMMGSEPEGYTGPTEWYTVCNYKLIIRIPALDEDDE
ncbi:unnamed protein product, partial [Didymodactylos carnosus]